MRLLFAVCIATAIFEAVAVAQPRGLAPEEDTLSAADFGTYRAVIIGIDDYTSWEPLEFAERDARELRDILTEHYGFAPERVVTLLGSEATESRIMTSLRDMLEHSQESDNLLIYYAGHGQLDTTTNTGFWIPVDGSGRDESTWIPFSYIINLLNAEADKVKAKSVAVITDSCYGGALLSTRSSRTPGAPEPTDERYVDSLRGFANQRSRQVIASGGFEEVPDRSQFAELLKAALRENTLRLVDLEFLFWEKIYPTLRRIGEQKPTMKQLIGGLGGDGLFVFLRDHPSGGPQPLPPGPDAEIAFWKSIEGSDNPELFREYIRRFPNGQFVLIARDRLLVLEHLAVPSVEGKSEADAKEALRMAGLEVGNVSRRESTHPRGTVLDQNPGAGSEARRGTAVDLTIASWPQVPDVVGLRKDEAVAVLHEHGFMAKASYPTPKGLAERGKTSAGPDTVIDQMPPAGSEAQPKTTVGLLLTGVIVPKLVGLDTKIAAATLEKIGLKVGQTKTEYVANERVGTVLDQFPKPGTAVAPGVAVDLSIAEIAPPSLVAPRDGAILDNGCGDQSDWVVWDFDWSDVSGASTYHLFVIGPGASVPAIDESNLNASFHREESLSYIAGHNLRGWRWKVRASVSGEWAAWSEEGTFDVEPLDTDCQYPLPVETEDRCYELVQGEIAWDYKGNKDWDPANVMRLCQGTSRAAEPGLCFERVMHGGIDWGGGTQWEWTNALDLCQGTNDATGTVDCFEGEIGRGRGWPEAIRACSK
ncbi:MAG: PASTA domain-containing protein [Vicinamibacteria bacterium]